MFKDLIDVIGEEAFAFIKKIAPALIAVPLEAVPGAYSWLLLHLFLFVFDHKDEPLFKLGTKILYDEDSVTKLKIIENGVSAIMRGLDAAKNGEKIDNS